jgi:hypothetical protein
MPDTFDPVERYLDEVMAHAELTAPDRRRVRAELNDHLKTLVAATPSTSSQEISTMLHEQFGNPQKLGEEISKAKGRFRTYLKKKARRLPVTIAVAVVLVFSVRWAVAQPFYVPTDAAAPAVPKGSRVLVYKWASSFSAGDVIVWQDGAGKYMLGTVTPEQGPATDAIRLARKGEADRVVRRADVLGKVVLNTR